MYALMIAGVAVAPAASAQILDADLDVRSTIDAATGTSGAGAGVNGTLNTDARTGTGGASLNATVNATGTATGTTGVTGATTTDGDDDEIVIRRSDLDDSGVTVVEPTTVTTAGEFEAYARSVMASDENVTKVSASADEVSVWYKENGRFLGFIPVTVSTRATVHADGEVEVDRPWYNFLTTTGDEADIEADISTTAGTIARAEGEAEFSAATQARLVNALRSVMRSHFEATASADVDAESNVNVNNE